MRKTYTLNIEGKNRDRLLEASKHDIRKYLKRERNDVAKALARYNGSLGKPEYPNMVRAAGCHAMVANLSTVPITIDGRDP